MLMGMDFNFINSFQNYRSLDNMIDYMNANYGDKYIFKYSTPSNYLKDVNENN